MPRPRMESCWIAPLLATCIVALALGCGSNKRGDVASIDYSQFAELPGLRASHDQDLQAELARIVDERATPKLMLEFTGDSSVKRTVRRGKVADEDNAAAGFAKLFDPLELKTVQHRMERLFPASGFKFSKEMMLGVRDALKSYRRQRLDFRAAVTRPTCDLRWQHQQGVIADYSCVENARAAIRLELFAVAELLEEKRPTDAIEPLETAFRAIAFLGVEPHQIPRQVAASARAECFRAIQAVVQHPDADKDLAIQIHDLIAAQLAAWPPDRNAWLGERAEGLHTYELVRVGHLLSVLDDTEIQRLHESKNFKQTIADIRQSIDKDELFYLASMRKIIDACQVPHSERRKLVTDLRAQMDELTHESSYPFVAIRVLLKDLEKMNQLQARDRALCEGWNLALALATDQPLPDFAVNPLTGAPYRMLRQKERAVVGNVLLPPEDQPLIVPIRATQAKAAE